MCRCNEELLNCVSRKMRFSPELRQLLIGISTIRYLPASGTAGFERSLVRGKSSVPAPPPMMTARVFSVMEGELDSCIGAEFGEPPFKPARACPRLSPDICAKADS